MRYSFKSIVKVIVIFSLLVVILVRYIFVQDRTWIPRLQSRDDVALGTNASNIRIFRGLTVEKKLGIPKQLNISLNASTEELNRLWSWTSFDAEIFPRGTSVGYYTTEELKPWIIKPRQMYENSYPGRDGEPYNVTHVSENDQKLIEEGWKKYDFNEYVCSKIPLHRYLGDGREEVCKARKWKKPLFTTSVIITFYNEAWCTLLRTVFSVMETAPKISLREIILVDDKSTYDNLKSPLDDFVKQLRIVKIIRMKRRLGIVPARMAGVRESSGDVLVFLDAHCETPDGWLEPLLERLTEKPNIAICPVLEDMPFDTFSMEFRETEMVPIGVTAWDLGFGWEYQTDRPEDEPKDAPIKSPVMVGGVFAIKRSYFLEIGAFDDGMKFWGGEQMDLSFKLWLCGGGIEIHPCSHVGHMHRKGFKYLKQIPVLDKNNRRVAEVWMDEYKEQFLRRSWSGRFVDPGDLSDRKAIRKQLGCKNFSWFLENLHPDLYAVPSKDVVYWGQFATTTNDTALCLDTGPYNQDPLALYQCHGVGGSQLVMYTRQGELRMNFGHELCMEPNNTQIILTECLHPGERVPNEQQWEFILKEQVQIAHRRMSVFSPGGQLKHKSGKCLEAEQYNVKLMPCIDSTFQIWYYRDIQEEKH